MRLILNVVLLFTSVFAVSTVVIMIKVSTLHPALLAALRLFVATAVLTPVFIREYRQHRAAYTWEHVRASMLPGLILAAHLISWIVGARMTPTANASFIIGLVPLVILFRLHALLCRVYGARSEKPPFPKRVVISRPREVTS